MTKTILLLGDSWGVPNYEGPPGDSPETHIEYRLRQLGYKVYNCSMNGGSNLTTIDLARKFLSGEPTVIEPIFLNNKLYTYGQFTTIDNKNPKIDVIIWFHTEFFRAHRYDFVNKTVAENVVEAANHDYQYVSDFIKNYPDAKLIVIGGQSITVTPILLQYLKPDLLIEDWRSEILGTKMPEIHTLTKPNDWVSRGPDSMEYKLDLLDKHKIVLDAMLSSPDFPDKCHPGGNAHAKLTERLHNLMSQMFNNTNTLDT